jgi:predicted esterase
MNNKLGFIYKYIPSYESSNQNTLLLLHGTGGNEEDLIPIGKMISPDAALLSPRGKVLENGMSRYFKRSAEGVFDQVDLRFRTDELAEFIGEASREYEFNLSRLAAVGYSNGANIAASLILRHPGLIKWAVLFHPMIPYVPDTPPDLSNVKILITAGRNDPIVSGEQTEDLKTLFQDCGADVNLFWQESGHTLAKDEINEANRFLAPLLI